MATTVSRQQVVLMVFLLFQLCDSTAPSTRVIDIPFLEEQAVGTEVDNLKSGLTSRSEIYYKMLSQQLVVGDEVVDDETKWVILDENTGVISVNVPVDREKECGRDADKDCVIRIKIAQKPQSSFELIDLNLEVIDVNDHAPIFPVQPTVVLNVSESAPITHRISLDRYMATDDDIGPNSNIVYTLSRNDFFSIYPYKDKIGDPHLELVVTDALDHEKKSSYDLILTATDRGSPRLYSSIVLRVRIIDSNDNAPVFDKSLYQLNLQENLEAETEIVKVHAKDADSSSYGKIRYFLPKLGNTLTALKLIDVDSITGKVLLKESLDREKHNDIRVVIGARDSDDDEAKIGKTVLEITIEDKNDNAPNIQIMIIVDSLQSTALLKESSPIGTYVAQVTATDADVGDNGKVTMEITTHLILPPSSQETNSISPNDDVNGYFVFEESGIIATGKALDRETYPGFLINIIACDKAEQPLCSSKNLTIRLLDENDNQPEFTHNITKVIRMREDTDVGSIVTRVRAIDRDSNFFPSLTSTKNNEIEESRNGNIEYELKNGYECFTIGRKNGVIRLAGSLDYEKKKEWTLTVVAKDGGVPSRSAKLTIEVDVVDINDNPPIFSNPPKTNHTILATIRSDDVITRIKAIDYDNGGDSDVWYSIVSEDGSKEPPSLFVLGEFDGNLRLNMSNPDLKDAVGSHSLLIKAEDYDSPSLQGFTTLRVEVYDVPLSVLPTFIKEKEKTPDEAPEPTTIIFIVSLGSATALLLLVLVLVVCKCKKENKKIRTYNCRSAESKKGWQLTTDHGVQLSDVTVTPSDHLMGSCDSRLNMIHCSDGNQTRVACSSDTSHPVRSNTSSISSERRLIKSMSSFSMEHRHQGISTQVDGDSGRGDSDHDTGSCEDKGEQIPLEAFNQCPNRNREISSYVPLQGCEVADMGPMCTNLCRQYGHSDSCWMPTSNYSDQESHYFPYHPYPHQYDHPYSGSYFPTCELETIQEMQPLHSVLGGEEQPVTETSFVEDYNDANLSAPYMNLPTSSGLYFSNAPSHPTSDRSTPLTSPRQCSEDVTSSYAPVTSLQTCNSPSDLFHDGLTTSAISRMTSVQYPVKGLSSASLNRNNVPDHNTNYYPDTSFKRKSSASLHGELLHRRFLASARGTSRADDVRVTSPTTSNYGEVSMEETQQIINDIDQLIDS